MRLDLSLPIEIRPLRDGDLDGLEWDSKEAIQPDYLQETMAERGDDVIFLLALAHGRPVGRLGLDFGRKAGEGIVMSGPSAFFHRFSVSVSARRWCGRPSR
jgi:hypothetical protein